MSKSRRVLLKLSGEALGDPKTGAGLSSEQLLLIASQIKEALEGSTQIAVVVGGGNFLRGSQMKEDVITRTSADHMGMLTTVLNGIALRDAMIKVGLKASVLSALAVNGIAEPYSCHVAARRVKNGEVVICTGGTGNPFVTTDSAASLRAIEIGADVLLKATKVDGIYDRDPEMCADAKRFDRISYTEVLNKELAVMDLAAFAQCRDYDLPIQVFNLFKPGALTRVLAGDVSEGTWVGE